MTYGYCDCLDCKYCPDRGLLDSACPISWKHAYDWDIPIDVYMSIVADIGCALFEPQERKTICGDNCKGECSGEVTGTSYCPLNEG